jgi:hypothetical protein
LEQGGLGATNRNSEVDRSDAVAVALTALLATAFAQRHGLHDATVGDVERVLAEAETAPESELDPDFPEFRDRYCDLLFRWEQAGMAPAPETPLLAPPGPPRREPERGTSPPPGREDLWSPRTGEQPARPVPESFGLSFEEPLSDEDELAPSSRTRVAPTAHRRFGTLPGTRRTRAFLDLADAADVAAEARGISPPHRDRLAAELLCFAVETECHARFDASLVTLWEERRRLVALVTQPGVERPAFADDVQRMLAETAERHRTFLHEAPLPESGLLHSLRYLALCLRREHYSATLLDYGALVLFFGFDRPLGNRRLPNALALRGLSGQRAEELAVLLIRLQRLRNEALNIAHFYSQLRSTSGEDTVRRLYDETVAVAEKALLLLVALGPTPDGEVTHG